MQSTENLFPHNKPQGTVRGLSALHSAILCAVVSGLCIATSGSSFADFDAGKKAFDAQYYDKARSEWSQAATQGDPQSQYHLGQLFDNGTGVRENNTQAYFWYALASLGGLKDATSQLQTLTAEMSAEEIERAKDLTKRFERVFAPVRYITSEPDSTVAAIDTGEADSTPGASKTPVTDASSESIAADTQTQRQPSPSGDSDTDVATTQNGSDSELDNETPVDLIRENAEGPSNNDEQALQPAQVEPIVISEVTVVSDEKLDASTSEDTAEVSESSAPEQVAMRINQPSPVENRGVLTETAGRDPQTHLRERMKSLIREVQVMLNELGYTAGPADGVIGKKTRQAVVRFQKENGLPDNGELGPRTIRALRLRS